MSETQGGDDTIGSLARGLEQPSNPWSDRQISIFDALRRISTLSSIVGSLLIIFMILKRRKSTTIRTYHRLLFSISVADVVASCACFVGPAAVPTDFPVDSTTCNIQAFFLHWCYCSTNWYNSAIMFYFTLTVVFEMKEDTLAARVEPFMHIFAILLPLGGAVTAMLLDSFNPYFGGMGGCWIASYPPGCTNSDSMPCTRGEHAHILVMAFVLVPAYFTLAVLYISIYLIYQAVKQRERLAHQATFRGSTGSLELSSTSSMIMLRSARTKATMFATVFFITYFLITFVETMAWSQKIGDNYEKYIPLFMLAGFLFPFQGFLNFVVYIHPRFMRIRRMRKDKSFLWVLWKSITLTTIVAHPVKSSTTKISGVPGSSQTEGVDHMLNIHVISQNEVKKQCEDAMVDAENGLKETENQEHIELDNC